MAGAAVYVRISKDRTGQEAGVTRQKNDCLERAKASELGEAEVYKDNDVSASKGRLRPAFSRMMEEVKAGRVDTIVTWKVDRLYRNMRELVDLIDLVKGTDVKVVTVESGDIDLSTPGGVGQAHILVAVAQMEADNTAYRTRRAAEERAKAGLPNGGVRCFGYQLVDGNYRIDEDEAVLLRKVVADVIAGRTLTSITQELNESGSRTPRGSRWTTTALARVIRSATVVGLRGHKGTTYPAAWPAIIDRANQELAGRVLKSNHAGGKQKGGRPALSLLTGLVRCGVCGAKMYKQQARYVCHASGGGKGCVAIKTSKLDAHVWTSALEAVPLTKARPSGGSQEAWKLQSTLLDAQERKDSLSEKLADGLMDDRDYAVARRRIVETIEDLEAKLEALPRPTIFRRFMGSDRTMEERRDYVRAAAKSITVNPGRGGADDRVRIEWAA